MTWVRPVSFKNATQDFGSAKYGAYSELNGEELLIHVSFFSKYDIQTMK
jgi:hypothetical protein